jgi:hypothetical protein
MYNEQDLVMTDGVQTDLPSTSLKDYCLSQLAHLQSLQNTPSLNFFYLHDRYRRHFINDKFNPLTPNGHYSGRTVSPLIPASKGYLFNKYPYWIF